MPGFSPRLAFGCRSDAAGQKIVARFFTAPCSRLSLRRGGTKNRCPVFHRGLASVVSSARPDKKSLPGFSPRLAFGCRPGTAREKFIARNFSATLARCIDLSRQLPGRCPVYYRALLSVVAPTRSDKKSLPEISTRPHFGAWNCRGDRPGVALFFAAPCFRLSPGRGRTKNHCPKLHRGFPSVHRFVAAAARTLPGFSPRLAFGCRPDAAGQKIIARNFAAPCFRLSLRRGRTKNHCPKLHRCTGCAILSPLPVRQYFFLQGVEALFPL